MGNFAFSFGITSVISILLGFWAGTWLDKKLETSPWLMLAGIFAGIFLTFQALFSEMKVYNKLEEMETKAAKEETQENEETGNKE